MKCNLFIWIDRQKWQSFVRPFDHDSFLLRHQSGNGYIRSKCHDFDIIKIYWLKKQTTNKQTNKQTKTHTVILSNFITSICRHRYIFIYLKLNSYIFYLVISFFFLIYLDNRRGEAFATIPSFLKRTLTIIFSFNLMLPVAPKNESW